MEEWPTHGWVNLPSCTMRALLRSQHAAPDRVGEVITVCYPRCLGVANRAACSPTVCRVRDVGTTTRVIHAISKASKF